MSVRATSNPTRTCSRARIVTRSNWSVPVNGGIVWKCRIGLFRRRAICSCMREVMLKLTMDYKMTKHMVNNCTLKESRTWLLVCTRHCYFIPFNHEPTFECRFRTYLPFRMPFSDFLYLSIGTSYRYNEAFPKWCLPFAKNLKILQFWSPGGHNFDLNEKMTEVLSYCFFLTIFRIALSACLRRSGAELDGGRIPPPPGRLCYNRSTGSARVNIDILLAKLIKPEKTKILTLNWPVTSSVTSKSNPYIVRRVHVHRAIE